MSPTILSNKDPLEDLIVSFPFSSVMAAFGTGLTIASAVVIATVYSAFQGAQDGNPSAILLGAPTISSDGSTVSQWIMGGVVGNSYLLKAVATLSNGVVLTSTGVLPISSM